MTDEPEQVPQSIINAAARHAMIKEQAAKIEAEQADRERQQKVREERDRVKARAEEDAYIEKVSQVTSERTMEDLHARIREMRKPPPDPEANRPPTHLTERQRQQLELEQQGGREAVARAETREQARKEALAKMEAQKRAQDEAVTAAVEKVNEEFKEPLVMPNPLQTEVFPTVKATLK
jgi:hypothetical protein